MRACRDRRREPAARLARPATKSSSGSNGDEALAEADRCFSCGTCILCDNCFHYCPDLAISRVAGGYAVLADYCKGCGMCVAECPTGSIAMREETR